MPRAILVPLDGSDLAERALPCAAALAAQQGRSLQLVAVHERMQLYAAPDETMEEIAGIDQEIRAGREAYLSREAGLLRARWNLRVKHAVLEGDPAAEISRYAGEADVELVVMTSHGRSGLSRLWLGSVAERLVRRCERPVLVLRADLAVESPAELFDTVLCPLDGSARAEAALDVAQQFVPPTGSIDLVMVVEPPFIFTPPPRPTLARVENLQRRSLHGYRYLRRLAAPLREAGRVVATHVSVNADAAAEIAAYALSRRASVIALASRGRGAAAVWLLGSVATKLIRSAGSAVLVVHTGALGNEAAPEFLAAATEADPMERAVPSS